MSFVFFALCAAAIWIVGIFSDVYLGDEAFHYRLARLFYESGRLVSEPHYAHVPSLGYLLTSPPLWYFGLSSLWKLAHSQAPLLTQGYQTAFFIGLLVTVYQMTVHGPSPSLRERGRGEGEKRAEEAFWSVWLAASCPMVVLFSVLLYLDVPAVLFSSLAFLCLAKRRFFLSGLCFGGSLLFKEYGLFLAPGLVLMILSFEKKWMTKIRGAFFFGVGAFLALAPEIWFRLKHFGFIHYVKPHGEFRHPELDYWYSPSSLFHDPGLAIAYLGLAIPVGLLSFPRMRESIFKVFGRKGFKMDPRFRGDDKGALKTYIRGDFRFLTWPILIYIGSTLVFFSNRTLEMRYFMPLIPFLSWIGGRAICELGRKAKTLVFLIGLAQFVGTLVVVSHYREMPNGVREGFEFIRREIPKQAVLLYPEENITTYTERPVVWGRVPRVGALFWGQSQEEVFQALKEAFVDYVVIPKRRNYDDTKVHHLGGYPRTFLSRLAAGEFLFLKKVFENGELSVWRLEAVKPS